MLITALVVGGYLYVRLDDEIRRYAESFLAEHYHDLEVRLGDARFEPGRGVVLRNLAVFETTARQRRQLLSVDEMHLLGNFDTESLISGKSQIERVVIRQPRLDALLEHDGTWNVARLFPPPSSGGRVAQVQIVDAVVSVADMSRPEMKPLVLREVQLQLTDDTGPPRDGADASASRYTFQGSIGGALAQSVRLNGWFDDQQQALEAHVEVVELALSSPLLASWPHAGAPWLDQLELSGKLNCNVQITRRPGPGAPLEWASAFALAQGRLAYDGLPRHFSDIVATGTVTHQRLELRSLAASYGKAGLSLVGVREGWGPQAPLQVVGKIDSLVLDGSLPESLPPSVMALWYRFRPLGEVSADFSIGFNGQRWLPDITVTCHETDFEDGVEFPYRLRDGVGTVRYYDTDDGGGGHLDINLTALAEGRPVQITGSLAGLTAAVDQYGHAPGATTVLATGRMELHGEQIPITPPLIGALGVSEQEIVSRLDPKGLFSFRWSYNRPTLDTPPTTATELEFHDCQICFAEFPYPLSNISGRVSERNGLWEFTNLVSRNPEALPGSREVRCHGTCHPVERGHLLRLTFTGSQIPLDDTLRQALPSHLQPHWTSLNPSGRASFTAVVTHETSEPSATVDLVARPEDRSVTVMPSFFRYRLEGIDGEFRFRDGQVVMTGVHASHAGSTHVSARQILWIENPQGGWDLHVDGLNVDRLPLLGNKELLLDAPPAIGKLVDQLQPQGMFSIHDGKLLVSRPSAGAANSFHWNIRVGLQQNDFDVGVPVRNASGMVSLVGRYENGFGLSAGQLDLDSVFWQGMQFTQVRGPLWVDNQECSLGEKAAQQFGRLKVPSPQQRKVAARFYGGSLTFDATMFHPKKQYAVEGRLEGTQLEQMSTEYFDSSVSLTGNMDATFTLRGGQSLDLLTGGGSVKVSDATMGELPIMVSLFKVLRNRAPDTTAFNGVDAQFRVVGKNLQFDQLDILGDAISLKGKGTVGFDRQADLVFYSYMGRHEINIPVVRTMLGQASANLMQISVTGPIDNARVSRDALPAVSSMIEQLNERGPPASPSSPTGSWWR